MNHPPSAQHDPRSPRVPTPTAKALAGLSLVTLVALVVLPVWGLISGGETQLEDFITVGIAMSPLYVFFAWLSYGLWHMQREARSAARVCPRSSSCCSLSACTFSSCSR